MAIDIKDELFKQSDVRETITNTVETPVLFNLDVGRYENKFDTNKSIVGMHVSTNGLYIYIVYDEDGASTVAQWTFGTRWDITSITETNTKDVDAQDTDMLGVFFKPDGLMMFLTGGQNNKIYSYTLTTAWDISTATATDNKTLPGAINPSGLYWREDGKRLFYGDTVATHFNAGALTTPWDISTFVTLGGTVTEGSSTRDLSFSKDGLRAFRIDNDEFVSTYILSIPFVPESKGAVTKYTIIPTRNLRGLSFNVNGSLMYVGANDGGDIIQYVIKRGWR